MCYVFVVALKVKRTNGLLIMGLGDTVIVVCLNTTRFLFSPKSIALASRIVPESKTFLGFQLMRYRGCPLLGSLSLKKKRNLHRFKCELNLHFYKIYHEQKNFLHVLVPFKVSSKKPPECGLTAIVMCNLSVLFRKSEGKKWCRRCMYTF